MTAPLFVDCSEPSVYIHGTKVPNVAVNLNLCTSIRKGEYSEAKLATMEFVGVGETWMFRSEADRDAEYARLVTAPPEKPAFNSRPHDPAHTCAGFIGGFVSDNKRNPTAQEIWDAAGLSERVLNPRSFYAKPLVGKRRPNGDDHVF